MIGGDNVGKLIMIAVIGGIILISLLAMRGYGATDEESTQQILIYPQFYPPLSRAQRR
jgi:hypothetical protein